MPPRSALPMAIAALALGAGLLLSAGMVEAQAANASASRVPRPVIEPAQGGECVADPAFMRRKHMDLLRHQRDETVHAGVRGAKVNLKECIGCHASRSSGSVAAAQTNFCVSCHSYAAVKIDCFECHATKP